MKIRILGLALALLLSGCSGGIYTPVAEVGVTLDSPILGLNDELPVVFPYKGTRNRGQNPMVEAYGPSWQDLHSKYPEYRFNP